MKKRRNEMINEKIRQVLSNEDKICMLKDSLAQTLREIQFNEEDVYEAVELLIERIKSDGSVSTGVSEFSEQ